MNRITLDRTELAVFPLALGCVNYGSSLADADADRQLSEYFDLGGNFIDTARIYGAWANRGPALSERIIASWLKKTGHRHDVVLSTKGAHPEWETMDIFRLHKEEIESDLDESLRMLETDCIDLYFLHRDDPTIPISEILPVLERAKQAGKIRYYGCSNWSLHRIIEADRFAKENGFTGFSVNQLFWGLPDARLSGIDLRNMIPMDNDTLTYMSEHHISAMGYTSMAGGYFDRRLKNRPLSDFQKRVYDLPENDRITELLKTHEGDPDMTPCRVTTAYFLRQPISAVPIMSFSSYEHLKEAVDAVESPVDSAFIDDIIRLKNLIH